MKKTIAIFGLSISMALVSTGAFAQGAKDGDIGDGCGLGWEITQKRTMSATTTRGTTNAFVPPTFGMTSGTIGCVQHPIAKNETNAVAFAMNNLEQIRVQAAEGKGSHVEAFAETLGCSGSSAGHALQNNYDQVFGNNSASSYEIYQNMKVVVQSACTIG